MVYDFRVVTTSRCVRLKTMGQYDLRNDKDGGADSANHMSLSEKQPKPNTYPLCENNVKLYNLLRAMQANKVLSSKKMGPSSE